MPVRYDVYQRAAPDTLIATLDQPYDKVWADELGEVGGGQFTIPHDSPVVVANPTILDEGNIVRVHETDRAVDLSAFRIKKKRRIRGDVWDPIQVSGPGVLDVLRYANVYPEYWPSELVADTRIFGFMSSDYTEDASWVTPSSHGTYVSRPFGDARPEDWSDQSAEYIADDTAAENNEGWFWLRAELVVSQEMDVRFEVTADEAFELYVAGIPLLDSAVDGEYQWASTFTKTITLPADTYQIGVKVWHADRPTAGTNIRWFLMSAMAAGSDGSPAAQNEVQHVHNDATTGNMSLTFDGDTTNDFAFNASASTVQTELNALTSITDAGGVSVTGSGTAADPWVVTWDALGNQPALSGTGDGTFDGTITITEEVDGSLPDVLLRSNTTDWTVLPLGSTEPGMTPGQILQVLVTAGQSRGWSPTVTYDFTATADTDGTAWAEVEFAAQVGNDNILSTAFRLGDLDVDVALSPELVLSAWKIRGTGLAGTVTLDESHCTEIACDWEDEIINTVLLRTKHAWYEAPVPAPASDRWEAFLSFGELTSEDVARDIVEAVLNTYDNPREVVTFTWPDQLGPDPYDDFDLGDHISAPGWTSPTAQSISSRPTKALAFQGREDDVGEIEWTMEGTQ